MEGPRGNLRCLKVESHGKDLPKTYMAEQAKQLTRCLYWGEAQAPWNDLQN